MYADISETEYREFGLQIRDLDSVAELEFQIKIPNWDLSFKLGTSDLDEISALNSVALCPVQVCYAGSASLLRKDAMSTLTPTNLNKS